MCPAVNSEIESSDQFYDSLAWLLYDFTAWETNNKAQQIFLILNLHSTETNQPQIFHARTEEQLMSYSKAGLQNVGLEVTLSSNPAQPLLQDNLLYVNPSWHISNTS